MELLRLIQQIEKKISQLRDLRNLLVHHGGVYTTKFLRQNALPRTDEYKAFLQGEIILDNDVHEWMEFIFLVSKKMVNTCSKAFHETLSDMEFDLDEMAAQALNELEHDYCWHEKHGFD